MDERTLKREGVCAASLPTTMVSFSILFCYFTWMLLLVVCFASHGFVNQCDEMSRQK